MATLAPVTKISFLNLEIKPICISGEVMRINTNDTLEIKTAHWNTKSVVPELSIFYCQTYPFKFHICNKVISQ